MKGNIFFVSLITTLCALIANAQEEYYSETKSDICMKQKVTKLKFYYHEVYGRENPTTVLIAQANVTRNDSQVLPFGDLNAVNSALRVGFRRDSKIIGRAKGLQVASNQGKESPSLVVYLDYGLDKGKFKGSSFVTVSRFSRSETKRELAVIGGREKFRMATGYAKVQRLISNATGEYTINKTVFDTVTKTKKAKEFIKLFFEN
ncbi:dirigent protein 4-like [Mercurialis annua]|uniref:dirigent protein 4-like n=1 Tax=Mercurialis annua TaxID=3986 RepID=UPI00215DFADC|nr:dirigent protein 4-like [Mercurialis annua]